MSPYDAMTAVTYPLGLKDDSERRNLMITFKRDPDAVQPFTMSEVQADIDAGLDTPACRKFDEIWNALGHASPPKRHRKKAQRSP
ncbi:MAG: hypothetical protein J2P55_03745 [Rhizobiales bacterium]|nr:hypothetical protein [Hyphomicrobiales bacterium]